jgi:biopolymer transport protein ExbD
MGEINTAQSRGKKAGVQACKKLSTRVDLTPMVDLGFLLITFFIFTTTMSRPKAMQLNLPYDKNSETEMPVNEDKILSLILSDNHIYYYKGSLHNNMQVTDYSPNGLRNLLMHEEARLQATYGKTTGSLVLIKPTDNANYSEVIKTIDEMLINAVPSYMLLDADKNDELAVKDLKE